VLPMKFLPLPTFNPENKMINYHKDHEICVSQYMEMVDEDSKQLAPAYKVFIDGEFWQDKFADCTEADKAARTAIDRNPDLFGVTNIKTVFLPNGCKGELIECEVKPLKHDGNLIQLRVAGSLYLTHWARQQDLWDAQDHQRAHQEPER
jgi:hypothetical protein